MSTAPHSPPDTPFKRPMALENELLVSRARLPEVSSTSNSERNMSPPEIPELGESEEVVQVPATLPPDERDSDGQSGTEDIGLEEPTRTAEDDDQNEIEPAADYLHNDLSAFDWGDLEKRYMTEINAASKEEDKLVTEFDQFAQAFMVWADAASHHDNDRAVKRLKTRQRFVHLSENALEQKKTHYVEVVQAFQKALALLRP